MFIFINLLMPVFVGFVSPIIMDWFTAPHRDPHWLKALIAMGGAILVVTLYQVLRESHSSLIVAILLAGACALAGTLCQRAVSHIRSLMKAKSKRQEIIAPPARETPREKQIIPPVLKNRREIGPLSQKKRTLPMSGE